LLTTAGAPCRGFTSATIPIARVADVVTLRDVDTLQPDESVEERLALAIALAVRLHQLADQLLALADHDEVHERGDGLGVGERADAAHQDQGVVRAPVRGAQRDPRELEQAQDVDVVALVGHREADQLEIGERALRFQRLRRRRGPPHFLEVGGLGQEHALAHDVGQLVEVGDRSSGSRGSTSRRP